MKSEALREIEANRFVKDLADLISVTEENGIHFVTQPNYEAWRRALGEIGKEYGYTEDPMFDKTRTYAENLVLYGADPKHILSVFTLLFG